MNKFLLIIFVFLSFSGYGQTQVKTSENAMTKLEEFKKKEKFAEDSTSFYTGVADPKMRTVLTEKLIKQQMILEL